MSSKIIPNRFDDRKLHSNSSPSSLAIQNSRTESESKNPIVASTQLLPLAKIDNFEGEKSDNKINLDQQISESTKQKIDSIISDIRKFNNVEKLFLYLQLPEGSPSLNDETNLKKKNYITPFGKKSDSDIVQTYAWIRSHLEENIAVSIPKHEVYDEYKSFCETNKLSKLCVADFGKAMKHIFPQVKPRRLGQRGNSKYCYSGLQKRRSLSTPELPIIDHENHSQNNRLENPDSLASNANSQKASDLYSKNILLSEENVSKIILNWIERNLGRKFASSIEAAKFLLESQYVKLNRSDIDDSFQQSLLEKGNHRISETLKHKSSNDNQNAKKKSELNGTIASKKHSGAEIIHDECINQNSTIKNDGRDNRKIKINAIGHHNNRDANSIIVASSSEIQTIIQPNKKPIRYKPIQPKPMLILQQEKTNIPQSLANPPKTSVMDSDQLNFSLENRSAPKSRQQSNRKVKKEVTNKSSMVISDNRKPIVGKFVLNENEKNYKRQMDEQDPDVFDAKKRHISRIPLPSSSSSTSFEDHSSHKKDHTSFCHRDCSRKLDILPEELQVNELENEALNDYLNNINNTNGSNSFVEFNDHHDHRTNGESFEQIKKLLENHLAKSSTSNNNASISSSNNSFLNYEKSSESNREKSSLRVLLTDALSQDGNSTGNVAKYSEQNGFFQATETNLNQKHSFGFQPISPMNDSTAHQTLNSITVNDNSNSKFFDAFDDDRQIQTNANKDSKPSSEINSPFMSPRNTPNSVGGGSFPRSRNNSGQSSYSNYRRTPLQNLDSGVSSISSSPFISPQSTPIPSSCKVRSIEISNNNVCRSLNFRARHNSGPVEAIFNHNHPITDYMRSNSLSPMIVNESVFFSNLPIVSTERNIDPNQQLSSPPALTTTTSSSLVPIQTDQTKENLKQVNFNEIQSQQISSNPESIISNRVRHRHFSNPYNTVSTFVHQQQQSINPKIENNSCDLGFKMLLNRSQSVPLHQMFDSIDTNSDDNGLVQNNPYDFLSSMTLNDSGHYLDGVEDESLNELSKSISTSARSSNNDGVDVSSNELMIMNDILSSTLDDLLINTDDSIIQSGQDLIVSSVQMIPNLKSQSIRNSSDESQIERNFQHQSHQTPNIMLNSSVEKNNATSNAIVGDCDQQQSASNSITNNDSMKQTNEFNDLLINDVESYPNAIDAFQDCDNEFSNIDLIGNNNLIQVYEGDFSVLN
ncbi:DNA-binding protein RFX5-like protein [Sarcoptes scabiei]|uniref:DNA-binding protein RFX5-like protein n=1 Tax=Sarcoptes scabiei TaxID=52283 RepID=A0A131ZSM5_SARSC|nr:DNA-binding protein RFX5-like protein [Sarcoptes scabiei]